MTNRRVTATNHFPGVTPVQAKDERSIRWVYYWLFGSTFITVPWMLFNLLALEILFSGPGILGYVLAVLLPACAHAILMLGFRSPHRYTRRHAQQALMLAGLRAISTVFCVGLTETSGTCFWILVNGFLWIVGTTSGLRQVKHGDCWLMRSLGESDELPRLWAATADVAGMEDGAAFADVAPPVASAPAVEPVAVPVKATPSPAPADPNAAFENGQRLLREERPSEATACFLAAFRSGPSDLRDRARTALADLGQIETF